MAHRRDAERIVKNLDGEKMAGEKVDIQHAKGKSSIRNMVRCPLIIRKFTFFQRGNPEVQKRTIIVG